MQKEIRTQKIISLRSFSSATIGIVLIVVFSVLSTANLLYQGYLYEIKPYKQDLVSLNEKKLEDIQHFLPARGIIGFVTDEKMEFYRSAKYFMTEYTLTPLIVVDDTKRDLVIGNFSDTKSIPLLAEEKNLTIIKDFGTGIVLFKQKNQ